MRQPSLFVPSILRRFFDRSRKHLLERTFQGVFHASSNPGRERYRRAGLTASATLIQRGLTITISLISVPLTIHYLGAERYGIWLTISSLLLWMALTDFGVAGNALINVLSEADGNGDRRSAQEYVSSAVWTLVGIGVVLGLAAAACFPFIRWNIVFRASGVPVQELNHACALAIAFFILSLPLSVQHSVYNAYQDGFVANVWGISTNLASLIALIVVTGLHGGLPQLVLALSGVKFVTGLGGTYYQFLHRYPWLFPTPSAVRWRCVRRLLTLGAKYMLTQLGAFGMMQSQPIIIAQILGPMSVIPFVVAQKVITLPMEVVYMSTAPLVPAFGEAKARNDWVWIKSAYRKASLGSLAIGLPILLVLSVAARPLIRVWAGASAVPEVPLILWLAVYNALGVSIIVAGQLLVGVERVNVLAASVVVCALITITSASVCCYEIGLTGVAVAMALSKLVILWPAQSWAVRRVLLPHTGRKPKRATQAIA